MRIGTRLKYQNMAMRTLGFAYKIVDDDTAKDDCVALVALCNFIFDICKVPVFAENGDFFSF